MEARASQGTRRGRGEPGRRDEPRRGPEPERHPRHLFPWAVVGVLVLVGASPAGAQRAGRTADDRCAELVKVAGDARSLEDLRGRIQRERPDEKLLRACAEALRRNPRVAEIVERERRRLRSREVRRVRVQRARYSKSLEELRVNRRVLQAREEASSRLRVVEGRRPEPRRGPGSRRRAPPTPAIERVSPSPVVPGTDLVVEGVGFGAGVGSVQLKLQGRTFDAAVNDWSETWISAYLSDEVSGVTESSGAVIEIRPEDGSPITRTVAFVPIYESDLLNDIADPLHAFPLPGERHEVFAEGWSLENGWRLSAEPGTQSSGGIECEIDGPPVAEPGSGELATRVHVAWGWFQLPICLVHFEVEGPKGFEHGFESSLF